LQPSCKLKMPPCLPALPPAAELPALGDVKKGASFSFTTVKNCSFPAPHYMPHANKVTMPVAGEPASDDWVLFFAVGSFMGLCFWPFQGIDDSATSLSNDLPAPPCLVCRSRKCIGAGEWAGQPNLHAGRGNSGMAEELNLPQARPACQPGQLAAAVQVNGTQLLSHELGTTGDFFILPKGALW